MKSPLTKKYTLASRLSQRLNQSLQESIFFSTPKKKFKNIFPSPCKKIKTPDTQAMTTKFTADGHRHSTTEKEGYAGNMGFANMAGTVGKSTVVHLINFGAGGQFCAFNPPHRKAPNRYRQPIGCSANIKHSEF